MRISITALCLVLAASPAAAQTHARHTATHDSAHAIMLDDAQHVALHQLLLGHWAGAPTVHAGARHDTLDVRFENDSEHQQLMVRYGNSVSAFEIRGDTLRWSQPVGGSPCVASMPVSALLEAAKDSSKKSPQIGAAMVCGTDRSAFTLRKIGS